MDVHNFYGEKMKKEMNEIRVETDDQGLIKIIQPCMHEDDAIVYVNPDQVNVLTKWLQEAKKEVKGK